ncbi:OTU domain-containing protein 6B [Purpureocillium lavendulum]|uniref:OTU domain-containing protein 6B n=1 Tax=Purpureocillium lavendulum TaxID=1247861 RepID=A0AB34FPV5_9HYPO|nr:OTU domain-containing protein 6B [Purpureocillium lavendulum]
MTAAHLSRVGFLKWQLAVPRLSTNLQRTPLRAVSRWSRSLAPHTAQEHRLDGREGLADSNAAAGTADRLPSNSSNRPPVTETHPIDPSPDSKIASAVGQTGGPVQGRDGAKSTSTGRQTHKRRRPRPASRPAQASGRRTPTAAKDFAKVDLSGQGRLTAEAWRQLKEERLIYQQWGYVRHQYSKSEVVQARRVFRSWKVKLHKVLEPVNPSSWPWREDGAMLFELDTVAVMRKAWESLDAEHRQKRWPTVMLSTMHLCPDKARLVLEATLDSLPPGYAVHDVLLFIAQRMDLEGFKSTRERTIEAEEILHLVSKAIEDTPAGHVPFSQRSFGLLAQKLPVDQVEELYTTVKRAGRAMHTNTLIHFARKLATDMAHKETAFKILKDLADDGLDLNDVRPASVVTILLHCKNTGDSLGQQKRPFSPKDALQQLVERGLSPNVATSTALLDSLCQQGEVEEAIRLALLFAESGVQLDTKAWSTVFRGAKSSLKVVNLIKALDVARAADAPYTDVLNNALHSVFYFAEMESREKRHRAPWVLPIFTPMLQAYAKKFDLEPLQWWLPESLPLMLAQMSSTKEITTLDGQRRRRWDFQHTVLPVVDKFFSAGDETRVQPTSTTLAIMIRAYIKSLQEPYELMALYNFFKSRLEEQAKKEDSANQLVKNQGSLIHDTFIMAMTEHRGLSRPALQVFGDMLKDNLKAGSAERDKARARVEDDGSVTTTPVHPTPSVLTFTILLRGLMNRREKMLAQQVIQVMREHGVEPNLVTWNTLTKGYASMQDIARTVATLQDMEAAGFKPDAFTFKAFGKLRDQGRALKMMEGIIDTNRRKMAGEEDMYQ